MIQLKKHYKSDGSQYISAQDVLLSRDENDPKTQATLAFLILMEKELNYIAEDHSTAFGEPELQYYQGMVAGYCMAKNWEREDLDDAVIIRCGRKKLFEIERPGSYATEHAQLEEI